MSASIRTLLALTLVSLAMPVPAVRAQAFTPPQGVGSVTFAWQFVDNTGHRGTDGTFVARGQSQTTSVLVETEYGVRDRFAVTFGVPYVFAKYTGAMPPPSGLDVDRCACWHSSAQDFALSGRYRFGTASWAVTPVARLGVPTHAYPYRGEAVVGRSLNELLLGVNAAYRLSGALRKVDLQASYAYAFVERALEDINIDRSSGAFEGGYALTRRIYLRGTSVWQHTHGGLRAGSISGNPFPLPGELNTPERREQRDRLLRTNYWQAGGAVAYAFGPADVFASVVKYVWGHDAHNGRSYNVGVTWYFDVGKMPFTLDRGHGVKFDRRRD